MYRISVTLDTSHKIGSNVVHSESSPQLKSQLICFLATFCSQSMSMLLSLEVVTATDIHVLTPEMATAKKTRKTKPHGSSRYGSHRGRREVSISISTLTESSNNIMWGEMERGEPPAPACVSGDGEGERRAEDDLIIPDPFQCLE